MVKVAGIVVLLVLGVGACYSAWWAFRIAVLALVPNMVYQWEQRRFYVDLAAPTFFIGAVLACLICCRVAWLLLRFLREPSSDRHSIAKLGKVRLF